MTAILRVESRRFRRGSLILTGVLAIIIAFFLAVFPAMQEEAEALEEAFPDYLLVVLGFEELHTIEGFAGGYVYSLVWVLFAGVYFAYISAGLIAGDIRSRKMDLTLSNPISRESVLVQKVAALWVPLAVLNVGMIVVMYLGSAAVGAQLELTALLMVHLLGLPYLLACAGIGVVLSVVADRAGRAQVIALGVVFLLWLVDGLSMMEPDYEWVGEFTPSRYYDPSEILVYGEYALLDAALLLFVFLGLLAVAAALFVRRDI